MTVVAKCLMKINVCPRHITQHRESRTELNVYILRILGCSSVGVMMTLYVFHAYVGTRVMQTLESASFETFDFTIHKRFELSRFELSAPIYCTRILLFQVENFCAVLSTGTDSHDGILLLYAVRLLLFVRKLSECSAALQKPKNHRSHICYYSHFDNSCLDHNGGN